MLPSVVVEVDGSPETLPPGFLDALRQIVPKRRRARLPYVVAAGVIAGVCVVGADPSTREVIAMVSHSKRSPPASAPTNGATVKPVSAYKPASPDTEAGPHTQARAEPASGPTANPDKRAEDPQPPSPAARAAPAAVVTKPRKASHARSTRPL